MTPEKFGRILHHTLKWAGDVPMFIAGGLFAYHVATDSPVSAACVVIAFFFYSWGKRRLETTVFRSAVKLVKGQLTEYRKVYCPICYEQSGPFASKGSNADRYCHRHGLYLSTGVEAPNFQARASTPPPAYE
jgi:hypothetical protein